MPLPSIDDLDTYGGIKVNYSDPVDPETDLDATQFNSLSLSVAQGTRTAIRAWVQFTGHASTPTLVSHDSVWGNAVSVQPTIATSGTNVYTITFPSTVDDALGDTHAINLRDAWAKLAGTTAGFINAEISSPNVVTLRCKSTANADTFFAGATISLFAI
jgi:hypothetical protein